MLSVEQGFFSSMPRQTLIAGILFVLAKICGFSGILFGFGSGYIRIIGGSLLLLAALLLVTCVTLCVRQLNFDKKKFELEDEFINLKIKKNRLKQEINYLENYKNSFT